LKQLVEPIVVEVDKLQVLRSCNEQFDVLLSETNLKPLSRDRKKELLERMVYYEALEQPDGIYKMSLSINLNGEQPDLNAEEGPSNVAVEGTHEGATANEGGGD